MTECSETLTLAARRRGAFGDATRQLLGVLASHAAVALSNASAVRRLEEMATTDSMTGLLNKRALEAEFERRIRSAARFGKPLAVIVADIDKFKSVNDTYGHAVGDVVIKGLGAILANCKRETDAVARFGGEEFVIVCEETEIDGAYLLAERIRSELSKMVFAAETGPLSVTCSLGVAEFPRDGASKEDLFMRADEALYEAKRAGRNQTRLAGRRSSPVSAASKRPATRREAPREDRVTDRDDWTCASGYRRHRHSTTLNERRTGRKSMRQQAAGTNVAPGGTSGAVGGTSGAVGGTSGAVGGTNVAVGGTNVTAGGTNVAVGGTNVAVGGTNVAASGTNVAACGTNVAAGGTNVAASGTNVTASGTNVTPGGTNVAACGTNVTACGTNVAAGGTKVAAGGTNVAAGGTNVSPGGTSVRPGGTKQPPRGPMVAVGKRSVRRWFSASRIVGSGNVRSDQTARPNAQLGTRRRITDMSFVHDRSLRRKVEHPGSSRLSRDSRQMPPVVVHAHAGFAAARQTLETQAE